MSTAHNPVNFNPADYNVVDYADNKRPTFYGPIGGTQAQLDAAVDAHRREVASWEAEMLSLFGADWRTASRRCVHCGNTNVRWVTAVTHVPTGEKTCFGADCTNRLGFASKVEFKLARLKRLADAKAASLKVFKKVEAFVAAHPDVAEILAAAREPVHAKNNFAQDVIAKLAKWGSISDNQIAAVKRSLATDIERASRPAEIKIAAPVGSGIRFGGVVVSTKWHESDYGPSLKMTVKVETPSGVWLAWGTVPTEIGPDIRGKRIELTANLAAGNDPSFAFFKRPRLARILDSAE